MTSLARQLDALRTSTAKQLTVERSNVSLLFEKKEAAKLDRETVHKIGLAGLSELRKLDSVFDTAEDLFNEANLNIQRTILSAEENEILNRKLDKLLLLLSPYMQHFACQQALELLVFRYQIQSYNSESFLMSFLPFHETNFFGRIIGILDINYSSSVEWGFMEEFAKKKLPVPFKTLVKNSLSSTHPLVTHIASHVDEAVLLVGEDWLESHAPLLFTLYAKLLLSVLDSDQVNDQLLSKLIPIVATGLKSHLSSLRNAALMVICKLVVSVKLNDSVVTSILKIILLKLKDSSLINTMSTVVVICQQQKVATFHAKTIMKLIRRDAEIGFWSSFRQIGVQTDLTAFLSALWKTLCIEMKNNDSESDVECETGFASSCDLIVSGEQALVFFDIILHYIADGSELGKKLTKQVYVIAVRFANEFDRIRMEWEIRDVNIFTKFVEQCSLQNVLVQQARESLQKRPRRRSRSRSKSINEDVEMRSKQKLPIEIASDMATASDFVKRQEFSGDPLQKALQWLKKKQWDELSYALNEMSSRTNYLKKKPLEDIEDLVLEFTKMVVNETKGLPLSLFRNSLAEAPLSAEFVLSMICRQELNSRAPKKPKMGMHVMDPMEIFKGESNEQWERRITFSLEFLNVRSIVPIHSRTFAALFNIVKQIDPESDKYTLFFVQQLAISLLIKIIKNPGTYKVSSKDLQMECVVNAMRSTHSHHVLRESLRLLTAAIQLSPGSVTAHVMSVFTFMGSGLLKKDNELTLGIIEDTLYALFSALVVDFKGTGSISPETLRSRLIDVARVFAASASDIPAHRRGRMAKAISRAIGDENAWIIAGVLFEGFCSKWQRASGASSGLTDTRAKTGVDQEAYEDLALEMCAFFEPVQQLRIVLEVISFSIRLGGDSQVESQRKGTALDTQIFDRSKYTVPKLRHFRFVLIGLAVKILSNRQLYEKLSTESDQTLYESMLPVGKLLLTASVELDEFVQKETENAEKALEYSQNAECAQTHRYWVALGARAETVSDKLRHILPGSVSARLISLVLNDPSVGYSLREKALALCNSKLLHDGYFSSDSGIHEQQLSDLAIILNGWIGPKKLKEEVVLCQNAAFTLKLIAKRLPMDVHSSVLAKTMELCTTASAEWASLDEAMTGNILLLAGELIRSHNMGTTMLSAEPLLKNCIAILTESSNIHKANLAEQRAHEEALNKRARMRQISLSGRPRGSDTLLICALTCVQRILDQFAVFVAPHVGTITVQYVRMTARFCDPDKEKEVAAQQALGLQQSLTLQQNVLSKHSIQYRLMAIRSALLRIEFRLMPEHIAFAVNDVRAEEKSLCSLFSLIGAFYTSKNQTWLVKHGKDLVNNVYLPALEYRSIERKPESFEMVSKVEKCVFDSIIAMADILTENQLKPVLNAVVNWAESGLNPNAEYSMRLRVVVLLHFANCFYDAFNSLALPYFGRLIEVCGKILRMCNAHSIDTARLLFAGKKDTVEALETNFILTHSLDLIANCAKHRSFFTEERASLISDALVGELDNTKAIGHESRCVPHLADAIYHVSEGHPQIFIQMLNDILLKTRSNRAKVRYRVLLVCERLFDRIGDAIAPQLPIIMPFLSELLEDENKSVEEQCDRIVRLLQKKFGADISEGFV